MKTMNFKNRFFFFPADTAKARVGVFLSFRSGDWVYIDIYLYWWAVMINLWKWPAKFEERK